MAEPTGTTLGLRTVIYHVPDLARATTFFQSAFGVAPYFTEPYYVGFRIGGFELGLDPDPSSGRAGSDGGTVYFGARDLEVAITQFLSAGATLRDAAREVGEGIRVATVRDPFGNVIGLIDNPHFDASAIR